MAENSSAQERTEEPTGKRIRDSRKKGQIARSRELNTTVMLLASAFAYLIFGDTVAENIRTLIAYDLALDRADMFDKGNILFALKVNVIAALKALAPVFVLLFVAVFIGPLSMGGWVFSVNAMAPKFSKLNPASGFKRMFGIQGLVELLKALAKFVLIGGTAIWLLSALSDRYLNLGMLPLGHGVEEGMELLGYVFLLLSATLIVVSGIDVPFQRWRHMSKLRMTKQEIKEENKETQGNPELKQRIRNVQYELSNRRMMNDVPTADVIITNPTHFSVALRYDQDAGSAPVLVAKGVDEIALKIREIGRKHNVPIFQAPPLARALYHHTEIQQEIPEALYLAVAQVLAYLYRLKQYAEGNQPAPEKPAELTIPPEYLVRD